jgi:hypothetical protein
VGMQGNTYWKTIWRLLKNLNIDLPYDQYQSKGYTQRNMIQVIPKAPANQCYCSTSHNNEVMELAKMPHYG